jgi:hypothetical protein
MITGVCTAVGAVIGMFVMTLRARRVAARAEVGEAVFFRVGVSLPAEGRGYSLGRVRAGGEFRWTPRWSWTRVRELPADLRYVRARETTWREMLWLPAGALVIECESSAGPVRLWAPGEYAAHVVEMLRRASART